MSRSGSVERKTSETEISLRLDLDGSGKGSITTGIGFFDHMLELFTKHGRFDLELTGKGDLEVDFHHLVEDVGICLGQAFAQAVGEGGGIRRFADVSLPMQESLARVAVDVSGRPFLVFNVSPVAPKVGEFDTELTEEFFHGFVSNARVNLHVNLEYGTNQHHIIEAVFKAAARALSKATRIVGDVGEVPSTKGTL
jgi:imidazoleglycerol-phosphate dehydratase